MKCVIYMFFFHMTELAHLINLKKLDLSNTWYLGTPNIQGKWRFIVTCLIKPCMISVRIAFPFADCKSLSRMKRLESINLSGNSFNKSIISCLTALPSLKILDLSYSTSLGTSFPVQGMFTSKGVIIKQTKLLYLIFIIIY